MKHCNSLSARVLVAEMGIRVVKKRYLILGWFEGTHDAMRLRSCDFKKTLHLQCPNNKGYDYQIRQNNKKIPHITLE